MNTRFTSSAYRVCASAIAISAAMAAPVSAQDDDGAREEGGALEVLVITASAGNRAQIDSPIAVTQVSGEAIQDFQPSSESELFRLLPGIQVAGTVGPGGNANIAVRGLPVAAGGAPFVQIQEDGLPTVLFGDIQFGNNDIWTNFDATTRAVEAVRGGTVSTFASQAPGAVINYISHTGEDEGGHVQLTRGLGFDQTRVDFRYGASINDSLRYHIGGYFNTGEGPLEAGQQLSDSIQVKANITQDIGDRGFFRFLFKFADTMEPFYTGAPAIASFDGERISDVRAFPGFDGRDQLNHSALIQDINVVNSAGDIERVSLDGITTEQISFGGHLNYEVVDNVTVDNKFRWSDISGVFGTQFLSVTPTSNIIGSDLTLNGEAFATVGEIRFANGPNAGEVFTDPFLDSNVVFRTELPNVGSFMNDLLITADFDTDWGLLTTQFGYFYASQDIDAEWFINSNTRELSGDNAAFLDLFDTDGNQISQLGISGFGNGFGTCCSRFYELNYVDQAPYAGFTFDTNRWVLDASFRYDRIAASGFTIGAGEEFFVNDQGVDIVTQVTNGPREILDYTVDYFSWTAGVLFRLNSDTSFFGRAARGNRFNADRQTFGGNFNADGSLNASGEAAAVDPVRQFELGVKNQGDVGFGSYTAEVTLLMADFEQNTFEISPVVCASLGFDTPTCTLSSEFESMGVEFFGTFNTGNLSLTGNMTYTDADQQFADANEFTRVPNLPDVTYTVSGNYDVNQWMSAGLFVTGQTGFITANDEVFSQNATFNGVLKFYPIDNLELGIDAFNIFDSYDIRTEGAIAADLGDGRVLLTGPSVLGRTVRASARYSF